MLVKSTCKSSIRPVATIGCRGTLHKLPSCCKQCVQELNRLLHLIGHAWPPEVLPQQGQSMVTSLMNLHPYRHPFKAATQWALGTTKCRRSSVSPLGIEHRYKAPWWIVKFCQSHKVSQPSPLEVCSARSAFKSVFFCAFSQSITVLNIGSSFWASAQSVMCICTRACGLQMAHTSCSKLVVTFDYGRGCELWPGMQFPMSLCWGWISLCLGPVK